MRWREPLDVARRHQHEAVAGGGDLLRTGLAAAADRGQAAGHRLDVGHAERLLGGGHHEQRAAPRPLERLRRGRAGRRSSTRVGDPQARGEPFERHALGAVADDHVAQRGVAVRAAPPARAARRRGACARPGGPTVTEASGLPSRSRRVRPPDAGAGRSAPRCTTRISPAPCGAGQLGDALAVGQHQPGGAQAACATASRPAGERGRGVEHVAAVHRDDQRHVEAGAAHGVAGRARRCGRGSARSRTRGAGGAARAPSAGAAQAPQRRVGARARRRDVSGRR